MGALEIKYYPKVFHFKKPSGTSRGVLTEKFSWFLEVSNPQQPGIKGLGECSVIPGLSPDYENKDQYESLLDQLCEDPEMNLDKLPSIRFGFESALLDLKNGGNEIYFDNDFVKGKLSIPINGLIWMGSYSEMAEQVQEKLAQGFKTIKMKIGAIEFEEEFRLLSAIRKDFSSEQITLRVDANGAFSPSEASDKLKQLSELEIHSIEQPIAAGQWEEMRRLVNENTLPIALDEELIGINDLNRKVELLEQIRPPFIILKPSLHGGISGTKEWIRLAEERNIQWWITSALESNVGLNAICQLCAEYEILLPQGLGTGSLYTDNVPSDLIVKNGYIQLLND